MHLAHGVGEDERVVHRQQHTLPFGHGTQLLRVVGPRGKGLHHQYVLPCLERPLRELEVRERRRGHHYEVDVGRFEHLVDPVCNGRNAILRSHPHRPLVTEIAHRLDLAVGMAREVANQVRTPVPASDHADAN